MCGGLAKWSEPLALPHRKCFFISEKHGKCSGLSPAFGGVLEVVQCVFAKLMVRGHIQHSSLWVWWISSFLQLWKIMEVHYKIQSCSLSGIFFCRGWFNCLCVMCSMEVQELAKSAKSWWTWKTQRINAGHKSCAGALMSGRWRSDLKFWWQS